MYCMTSFYNLRCHSRTVFAFAFNLFDLDYSSDFSRRCLLFMCVTIVHRIHILASEEMPHFLLATDFCVQNYFGRFWHFSWILQLLSSFQCLEYELLKSSNKPTKCSNDVAAIISREVALPEWLFSYDYLYYIVKNILV